MGLVELFILLNTCLFQQNVAPSLSFFTREFYFNLRNKEYAMGENFVPYGELNDLWKKNFN
jgi:hypothetical protein